MTHGTAGGTIGGHRFDEADFDWYRTGAAARLQHVMDALLHPRRRPVLRPAAASAKPAPAPAVPVAQRALPATSAEAPVPAGNVAFCASHSVRLRPKTLVRLRGIAHELEVSVSAVIKHAVEEAVEAALQNRSFAVPIRGQKSGKNRAVLDPNPQPVRLEPGTEAGLRSMVAQSSLLNTSAIIRGAVEHFVENAFREKEVVFRFGDAVSPPVRSSAKKTAPPAKS